MHDNSPWDGFPRRCARKRGGGGYFTKIAASKKSHRGLLPFFSLQKHYTKRWLRKDIVRNDIVGIFPYIDASLGVSFNTLLVVEKAKCLGNLRLTGCAILRATRNRYGLARDLYLWIAE